MEFYCSVFPDSRILSIERYPDESLDEHFKGMSGKVLTGRFVLDGTEFICLDGGPAFTFNEAISLTVECADQAEIDHYWSNLSASPEQEQCGWLKDRFGVSWQIVPANLGELMTGPAQTQALMQMKKIVIDDLVNAG
ncbi:VOC family protein [Brevibacterium pigmentatum]|uniref:VOC family protein n=1 Tax=Brevibacterium pigmentatum TaxID=1496080 RepID=UPI002B1BD5B7|nr:VOC family protein [Brevibacterium pigmentatum]